MNSIVKPLRILGIDPGSRRMGYAVIELIGKQPRCVFHDTLVIINCTLPEKLGRIFTAISEIIQTYQPDEVAIEQVFLKENVQSALKLGQARGAAIAAVGVCHLPLSEYAPRQIKQAVVGFGGAEKEQVQLMVRCNVEEAFQELSWPTPAPVGKIFNLFNNSLLLVARY